jgi:hypothetical protein
VDSLLAGTQSQDGPIRGVRSGVSSYVYISMDNGNTCYIRRGRKKPEKDWICAVNTDLYKSYVCGARQRYNPTTSVHDNLLIRFLAGLLLSAPFMIFDRKCSKKSTITSVLPSSGLRYCNT